MSQLGPVPPRERLVTLDVLRALALCGVLVANLEHGYNGLWPASGVAPPPPTTLDEIATWILNIFVASKAQTLLTLLFGYGFAAQLLRAQARHEPVVGLYVRRLVALFVFGALHVVLFWWGDVTWTYAVSGFGLLAFVRASDRTRVIAGLLLIFVPFLVWCVPEVRLAALRVLMEPQEWKASSARMGAALVSPDHAGLGWEHVRFALVWSAQIYLWYFLWALGRFLLGFVAGARRWFDRDGADHLAVFRRLAVWGAVTGVVTTAVSVIVQLGVIDLPAYRLWVKLLVRAAHELSLLAMALAYVGIVVLLLQRAFWRGLLGVLAPAGRMPLTTYVLQSPIATFLYYGWGLGWARSVGAAGAIGLGLAIFAVEVALCHLWLRYFRFGPLEWLWRTVVYLRPPPMRT